MKIKFVVMGLALFAILSVGATALWLGGFKTEITGSYVQGGSVPSQILCSYPKDSFGSTVWGGGGAYPCSYTATADTNMEIIVSDTFTSSSSSCVFVSGVDLEYAISLNGGEKILLPADTPVPVPVLAGINTFDVWFKVSESACPSNVGVITFTGTELPLGELVGP